MARIQSIGVALFAISLLSACVPQTTFQQSIVEESGSTRGTGGEIPGNGIPIDPGLELLNQMLKDSCDPQLMERVISVEFYFTPQFIARLEVVQKGIDSQAPPTVMYVSLADCSSVSPP